MEHRQSKESDQNETERAFQIIQDAISNHPEIEPTLWCGALFSKIAQGCLASKITYKEFCDVIEDATVFYKSWWEDDH